uniref:Dna-directed rna polymerase ii-related n=1 Tax=Asparagus officinalis TaxID=4686 RepID=Q2XNV7_ASPOF|nr:dna-directed rna polymerase ii - related [Asparagus officinalis]
MMTPESSGTSTPLVQQLETSEWAGWYQVKFREILRRDYNYEIACKFPAFEGGAYGELHQDTPGPNSFIMLSRGVFWWLISIRPGYLIFRQGRKCFIEPYQPYRFSRQFGYDQLYVGNPNPTLAYTVAGCTGAKFRLPHKMPNARTSLSFCTWYQAASQILAYNMNTSYLKAIRKWYASKKSAKRFRACGANEYLSYEKSIPEDERQQSPEQVREEVRMPDTREVEASRVQTRSKSTTGKRALGPVEEGKYDKRARRKLTLEPSASKLMSDAQKAWHTEEEEQESTAMELSPQPGLPTVGPALGGHDSSAYSLHEEERGDESFAGGAEFVPEDTLHDTSSTASHVAEDIAPAQEPLEAAQQGLATDKSPSASVLLPIVGDSQPSPTTGIIAKPTVVEDAPAFPPVGEEEPMDHSDGAGATDDEGDPSGNEGSNDNLGDDSDDLDDWDIPPPSFSDKASAYVPLPLTGKIRPSPHTLLLSLSFSLSPKNSSTSSPPHATFLLVADELGPPPSPLSPPRHRHTTTSFNRRAPSLAPSLSPQSLVVAAQRPPTMTAPPATDPLHPAFVQPSSSSPSRPHPTPPRAPPSSPARPSLTPCSATRRPATLPHRYPPNPFVVEPQSRRSKPSMPSTLNSGSRLPQIRRAPPCSDPTSPWSLFTVRVSGSVSSLGLVCWVKVDRCRYFAVLDAHRRFVNSQLSDNMSVDSV